MRFLSPLLILTFGILAGINSCKKQQANRAFYYWRTTFKLSETEKEAFTNLKIKTIYLRYFDVIKGNGGTPIPDAVILFKDSIPKGVSIIPVVYIKNEVLKNMDASQIDSFVKNVYHLIQQISASQKIKMHEIQMDCDWTLASKTIYFKLLRELKALSKIETLSATIRLHQVKYKDKTGVPPVDRGMLMFYNMGSINLSPKENSILDASVARQYTQAISSYPLTLDGALPIFHWAIHGNEYGVIKGIVENISKEDLLDSSKFKLDKDAHYIVRNSFLLHGNYLNKNDQLKFESVDFPLCEDAAAILHKELQKPFGTLALFASDSSYIKKYSEHELEEIYSKF